MKTYLKLLALLPFLLCLISCNNGYYDHDNVINVSNIKGLVEKGPFISGSSVSVYELDTHLNPTGRVFETKTNDEGAFSFSPSSDFVSKYVKLSVSGFYFNEHTGKLSGAPIVLEAITSIENTENPTVNVNILTHLEMPRVMKLVASGKKFEEAKLQAQKELLLGFLIKNVSVVPEETSITGNNTSADVLIAISSILLNEKSDAQFSEFMSILRNDLEDGEINAETEMRIADSSFGLDYLNVAENIKNRYEELGKTVEVGDFQIYIDGDSDGEIGDTYIIKFPIIPTVSIFDTEEGVKLVCTDACKYLNLFAQKQYLLDGLYTNTIDRSQLNQFYNLISIYEHNITSSQSLINEL